MTKPDTSHADHEDHDPTDPERAGHGPGSGHDHNHPRTADGKALAIVATMTGSFLIIEALGGWISGSLALLADAGHMLTDFAALIMAWAAVRMAQRAPDTLRTYGYDRVAVLAAFVNGLALFLIAIWIVFEAWERLGTPEPVAGGLMLVVATAGLIVNIIAFRILTRGETSNLNMRAAILHVAGDLLGSVAAIVAALVILATGWTPIDPILSVFVTLLILRSAYYVVRDSARILLEASPIGFDPAAITADLTTSVPGLLAVRHVHAWSISEERPMATLEAVIAPGGDGIAIRAAIKARLAERFGIGHATVEIHDELFPDPAARLPDGPPASI